MRLMISIPRSGSHVFAQMTNSKMFVLFQVGQPTPIDQAKPHDEIMKALGNLNPRRNYWTHLPYHYEYESFVNKCDRAFLLLRDPRDVIVSHAYVVEKKPNISLNYFIGDIKLSEMTFRERVDFLIDNMRSFFFWFECWRTFGLPVFRYETFVNHPEKVFGRLSKMGYGSESEIQARSEYKHPGYYRRGIVGEWRVAFTNAQKERAEENFGDFIEAWKET